MAVLGDSAIALHLCEDDAGCVWYARHNETPKSSGQTMDKFLKSPIGKKAQVVRMPGAAAYSAAIIDLYGKTLNNSMRAVQVCSPAYLGRFAPSGDPIAIICAMQTCKFAPSCGGWSDVTDKQCPSFMLAKYFGCYGYDSEMDDMDLSTVTFHLRQHAMWPAMSFIDGLDVASTAKLLALVIDPRFFVDHDEPDSLRHWDDFFGFNSGSTIRPTGKLKSFNVKTTYGRFELLQRCWKSRMDNPPTKDKLVSPGSFMWRRWLFFLKSRGERHADFDAARCMSTYIRLTWLDALYGVKPPWGERLFVPEFFFDSKGTAKAWRADVGKV